MNDTHPKDTVPPDVEAIIEKMTAEIGQTPHVMELLAGLKPAMVAEQARSKQFANTTAAIPEKYAQLISIAAAAASGTPSCVRTQIAIALRKGVTPEEVVDTLILARFALASTVFSSSVGGLELLAESVRDRA